MSATIIPLPLTPRPVVAEFFAGIGLARLGLERAGMEVVWANDLERFKHEMYEGQFGKSGTDHDYVVGDIAKVTGDDLPDINLAWSSFPCTDLSLAGGRAGLAGKHSSTFYQFTRVLEEMGERRPEVVALENVTALASSHGGEDLAAAIRELNRLGYSVDVIALDARRFVPQSRPRLFVIAAQNPPADEPEPNSELRPDWLQWVFGDETLRTHRAKLPAPPAPLTSGLGEQVEKVRGNDTRWWDEDRTARFTDSLSSVQKQRLDQMRAGAKVSYRTAYRRTRNGVPVWEIRADDVSGCLRTARGGSSKQAVVKAGRGKVQVRWMTPLEYARLMGAGNYNLEGLRDSQILFGFGDAVCVDAVAWVGENYLQPLICKAMAGQVGVNDSQHAATSVR
ncbi:DNA cytosine methyltransferase [Micrococcus luteus]|uniref:DNA cytosine methyltransferase n=1 Tax=Micrococcus luteus TaxID=1270 RepID=UPI0037AF58F5